ncbi:MAG: hypothetical protein H2043_22625 [Rhizobiales bacterium]|nr:hypothetical protein [Hyphomicrobiales bacterium]
MSIISDRLARVRLAVDREWGEPFAFVPMADAPDRNGAPIADVSRQARTVIGRWSDKAEPLNQSDAYDQRTDKRPGVSNARTTIFLSRQDALPGELELWVRRRDRLTRVSDGSIYQVVTAIPSGRLRIRCDVNKLG